MLVEFGQARQDVFASLALEVVASQMLGEGGLIWTVKGTAGLQTMLVSCQICQ